MTRRDALMLAADSDYTTEGLQFQVDSLLNTGNTLVDQTGNYSISLLEGTYEKQNDAILLRNTRYLVPLNTIWEGSYTIIVLYRRLTNGLGAIWSLADPSTYLVGRMAAGHDPNSSTNWKVSAFSDWQFLNNDTNIHQVTFVKDYENNMGYVYDNGLIVNTYHGISDINPQSPYLSLIIGGYINADKRTEFGELYALRVYNKPLTASEVRDEYQTDKLRFGL